VCAECRSADPESSQLIVIRGNSASGKSTIASLIREKHGRGLAVVGQDNLRRVVLREHDTIGAANVGLIDLTCRFALGNGFHVVLEGILRAERYGAMLAGLREEYADRSSWWFIDIPFSETLQRHSTKPQVHEYGEVEMRSWWHEQDFLPGGFERVITVGESAEAAATRIMTGAGLTSEPRPATRPNVSQLLSPIHRRSRCLIVTPASSMPMWFCAVTARSCCCAERQVFMPRGGTSEPGQDSEHNVIDQQLAVGFPHGQGQAQHRGHGQRPPPAVLTLGRVGRQHRLHPLPSGQDAVADLAGIGDRQRPEGLEQRQLPGQHWRADPRVVEHIERKLGTNPPRRVEPAV
jgi:hypothetical protein